MKDLKGKKEKDERSERRHEEYAANAQGRGVGEDGERSGCRCSCYLLLVIITLVVTS